jgi:hypothetical protein
MDSRFGYRPINTCSKFDNALRCLYAFLINHSAAYGRTAHLFKRLLDGKCVVPIDYPEIAEWRRDYLRTVRLMAVRHRVYVVEFPGLAIKDDVLPELRRASVDPLMPRERRRSFACIADHFEAHRRYYDTRITVIRETAKRTGVPILNARSAYIAMPARQLVSYFVDEAHQTAEGNAFLAKTLYRAFAQQWRAEEFK